jgi:hypothetical protein
MEAVFLGLPYRDDEPGISLQDAADTIGGKVFEE